MIAITSFPHGSAGGPDGLQPQHLKDLLANTSIGRGSTNGERGGSGEPLGEVSPLLQGLTDLVNLLLAGKVPLSVRSILFGGTITAITKKGGGVRPIAVGYTLRRLAGKVTSVSVQPGFLTCGYSPGT